MADIKDKEARSNNMAHIHNKNTKPELCLRKLLFSEGYRYRLHTKKIPGHPDIWLKKYNTAIFVNGCFWHRHNNCKFAYIPKSNVEFWEKKFFDNTKRDELIYHKLSTQGIKCLVVWECTIKKAVRDSELENQMIRLIKAFFVNSDLFLEL